MERYPLYINGERSEAASGAWIAVDDPATEEIIAEVPAGGEAEVARAVEAAQEAFKTWRWMSANERAGLLHEAAHKTHEAWEELVTLLTREQGKPRSEQEEEFEWAANTMRYYAELARNSRGRVLPSQEPRSQLNLVLKEPYGVVGAIIPWNYPIMLLGWKLGPALAAGNTLVIKPSELTPLSTLRWIERCFDHFPPGVLNVVTGYGKEAGEALVRHPAVRVVAFTGSLETGQRIASIAAPMMKHMHLELGGKDAFVIAPDADIERAVEALSYSALINAGQVCTSSERIYVPSNLLAPLTEGLREKVGALRLGHGLDAGTDMGPMIGDRYRAKVERHVADARAKGATLITGGQRPAGRGYFYEPTVLVDVTHEMDIMQEETFGPTIPIMTYDDFDSAIEWVNAHPFGLGATLRSNDPKLIKKFFEEVKAGTVWINDPLTDNYAGPFGGMKMTGGGRELGEEGLETFMETKHVHWDFSDGPKSWWFPY